MTLLFLVPKGSGDGQDSMGCANGVDRLHVFEYSTSRTMVWIIIVIMVMAGIRSETHITSEEAARPRVVSL